MAAKAKKKTANNTDLYSYIRKYGWPTLALASIIVNLALIGGITYIIKMQPLELTRIGLEKNCSVEGYAKLIKLNETHEQKKFAAAAVCFADYDTGKPLDIDSLKARSDAPVLLPPKQ